MLNQNKIKQPKQLTLEYYKIARDEDKYVLDGYGFHIITQKMIIWKFGVCLIKKCGEFGS